MRRRRDGSYQQRLPLADWPELAFRAGFLARLKKRPISECPYSYKRPVMGEAWRAGWKAADRGDLRANPQEELRCRA